MLSHLHAYACELQFIPEWEICYANVKQVYFTDKIMKVLRECTQQRRYISIKGENNNVKMLHHFAMFRICVAHLNTL